jgi:hypothetical protein
MSDQKKKIQFSEMVNYENVKNLYELSNENHNLSIESSMMLEEFRNTNENQGLLSEDFLKLVRLDSTIY